MQALNDTVKERVFFARGFSSNGKKMNRIFSKVKEVANPIGELLSEYSNVIKGINAALTIKWQDFVSVEKKIKCRNRDADIEKKLVIVFDDFERCKIDRIELMGALNDYCENKEIKIVIVADEEHINDEEYSEFKEKLISRTIRLDPDYEAIIDSIIRHYKETEIGYVNFLKANIDYIHGIFVDSGTQNFRSLKSFLLDYERVYAAWRDSGVSTKYQAKAFYAFGAITFAVKAGEYEISEYGDLFPDAKFKDKYHEWSGSHKLVSLRDWAVEGTWDKEEFIREIKEKYVTKEISDGEKILKYDFWELDGNIIQNGFPQILNSAYQGMLTRSELSELLKKVFALKKYKIPVPTVDYDKIYKGFEYRCGQVLLGKIEEPKMRALGLAGQVEDAAKQLCVDMEKFDNILVAHRNKQAVIDYLHPDSKISDYQLQGLIIGYFDKGLLEEIWLKFIDSDNYGKRMVAKILYNLSYNDPFYTSEAQCKESIESFHELKRRLNEYLTIQADCMTIAIINLTIESIEQVVEKISKD